MKNILKQLANVNGWIFKYARKDYQNTLSEPFKGKTALIVDPITENNTFGELNDLINTKYTGDLFLCVESSLNDVDYEYKYDEHIQPLRDSVKIMQEYFTCAGYRINTLNCTEVVNIFDYNVDGILIKFDIDYTE